MMNLKQVSAAAVVFGFAHGLAPTSAYAENDANIALIMDASGSMNAKLDDGTSRIDAAKSAISEFTKSFPSEANISLRAYGHQSHRSKKNCKDTQVLVPFGKMRSVSEQIVATSNGLQAQGYTPISHVLGLAAADLAPLEGAKTVVLISDGKETCEGDPCQVAKGLAKADIGLVIHTVGFGVDVTTKQQLQCIARVARGEYFDAKSASDLSGSLIKAVAVKPKKKKIIKIKSPNGTLELVGPSWNNIAVLDAETNETVGSLNQSAAKLILKQGIYNLKYNGKLVQKSVHVTAGEVTKLTPAQVKLQTPDTDFLYILDQETGERLADINAYSSHPDTIPAGRYDFALGNQQKMKMSLEVKAGVLNEIPSGMIQIEGPHWEVKIKDIETGEFIRTASWNSKKFVLFPGKYSYGAGRGHKLNIPFEVKAGETTTFNPGGITIKPNGDYKIFSKSGEHVADHNSLVRAVRLPDGEYVAKLPGVDVPFEISDGEMVEINAE